MEGERETFAASLWRRAGFDAGVDATGVVVTWGETEVYHGDADGAVAKFEQETGRKVRRPWEVAEEPPKGKQWPDSPGLWLGRCGLEERKFKVRTWRTLNSAGEQEKRVDVFPAGDLLAASVDPREYVTWQFWKVSASLKG